MNPHDWRSYVFNSVADAAMIVLDERVLAGGISNSVWCTAVDEWITIDLDANGRIAMIQFMSASRLLNATAPGFQPQFSLEFDPLQDHLVITLHPPLVPTAVKKCDARCAPVRILFAGDRLCGFEIHPASTAVQRSVIEAATGPSHWYQSRKVGLA